MTFSYPYKDSQIGHIFFQLKVISGLKDNKKLCDFFEN